jgi:flavin-dependent dehydrogenase
MSVKALDTLVIGTGPAGEGAAMKLAKARQRVAVVEAHTHVAGGGMDDDRCGTFIPNNFGRRDLDGDLDGALDGDPALMDTCWGR